MHSHVRIDRGYAAPVVVSVVMTRDAARSDPPVKIETPIRQTRNSRRRHASVQSLVPSLLRPLEL